MAKTNKTQGRSKQASGDGEEQVIPRIRALLDKFEAQMDGSELKVSVGDYIRLIQMKRELDETEPRDIEVRWVDHMDEPDESGK
jgi:hypothetical protein